MSGRSRKYLEESITGAMLKSLEDGCTVACTPAGDRPARLSTSKPSKREQHKDHTRLGSRLLVIDVKGEYQTTEAP